LAASLLGRRRSILGGELGHGPRAPAGGVVVDVCLE
jgi:hypothetical protein